MKNTHLLRLSKLFSFVLMIAFTFGIFSCGSLKSFINDPIVISWTGLTANGTAGTEATTELTLIFDKSTSSLKIENITIAGAVKGTLGGTGNSRTLSISDITVGDGEEITVTITNPNIYDINPLSKSVVVYTGNNFTKGGDDRLIGDWLNERHVEFTFESDYTLWFRNKPQEWPEWSARNGKITIKLNYDGLVVFYTADYVFNTQGQMIISNATVNNSAYSVSNILPNGIYTRFATGQM